MKILNIFQQLGFKRRSLLIVLLSLSILSCGSEVIVVSGITGTGIVVGTITGFGSIIVNGVHYNIDNASIDANGVAFSNLSKTEQQQVLAVGMVVRLKATDNGDGTGDAESVVYDASIKGPVLEAPVPQTDPNLKVITVLGQQIEINALTTSFKDFVGNGFDVIAQNDIVEVSGYIDQSGNIKATLVKKEDDFQPGENTEVELHGVISDLDLTAGSFTLKNLNVEYDSSTEFKDGLQLANGLQVEVKGLYQGSTTVVAEKIEADDSEKEEIENAKGEVKLQGLVVNLNTAALTFELNGVTVDYSQVAASAAGLVDDAEVEVRGEVSNGVLVITKLEIDSEDGDKDD